MRIFIWVSILHVSNTNFKWDHSIRFVTVDMFNCHFLYKYIAEWDDLVSIREIENHPQRDRLTFVFVLMIIAHSLLISFHAHARSIVSEILKHSIGVN